MSKAKYKLRAVSFVDEANVNVEDNTVEINGKPCQASDLSLDSPVSGTIYGALLNYKGSVEAMGNQLNEAPYNQPPKAPVLYIKPANTISSYNAAIPMPAGEEALEMGAALGVVIGRTATRVSESDALSFVSGYTVVNDVSIPHESVHRPAIVQKARDGFCPVGPWIVDSKEISNPDNLAVKVYINNELQQENTTANLVRSVSKLLADVTDFMTLHKGDMLLVGIPENAPTAKVGDHVRIEIAEVGALENNILAETDLVKGAAQ